MWYNGSGNLAEVGSVTDALNATTKIVNTLTPLLPVREEGEKRKGPNKKQIESIQAAASDAAQSERSKWMKYGAVALLGVGVLALGYFAYRKTQG